MNKDIERILVSEDKIEGIITELAEKIDRDYSGSEKKLLLLCISRKKERVVFIGQLNNSRAVIKIIFINRYGCNNVDCVVASLGNRKSCLCRSYFQSFLGN